MDFFYQWLNSEFEKTSRKKKVKTPQNKNKPAGLNPRPADRGSLSHSEASQSTPESKKSFFAGTRDAVKKVTTPAANALHNTGEAAMDTLRKVKGALGKHLSKASERAKEKNELKAWQRLHPPTVIPKNYKELTPKELVRALDEEEKGRELHGLKRWGKIKKAVGGGYGPAKVKARFDKNGDRII